MRYIAYTTSTPSSPLRKVLAVIVTAALAVLGFMFSAVLLAVVLVAAVLGGIYVWWKTREVRKQMQQMQQSMRDFQAQAQAQGQTADSEIFRGEVFEGEIIEGEVIHRDERK